MDKLIEDRIGRRARIDRNELAILVGLDFGNDAPWEERESMEELIQLSRTAGVGVLNTVIQRKRKPDPSYFIGEGKAEKVREQAHQAKASVIIFNDELSPAQSRNLEEKIEKKIIDRSQLIMDIFSQRARSKEAKLQVELAQLEYLLPRLRGWGKALARLGGGIATRGPGETRMQKERRNIERRIDKVKKRLEKARVEREIRRKKRRKRKIPEIAIIGYTNAGKTTLLNQLCDAHSFVEDKLFATLDSVIRRSTLPRGREVLFADTVGFIKKLPPQLIPAFRATLESVKEANLLLNVMDISHSNWFDHWRAVNEILNDLFEEGERTNMLTVFNKIDQLETEEDRRKLANAKSEVGHAVEISASQGTNLDELRSRIACELGEKIKRLTIRLPYSEADLIPKLHRIGVVHQENYENGGIVVEISVEESSLSDLRIDQGANVEILPS